MYKENKNDKNINIIRYWFFCIISSFPCCREGLDAHHSERTTMLLYRDHFWSKTFLTLKIIHDYITGHHSQQPIPFVYLYRTFLLRVSPPSNFVEYILVSLAVNVVVSWNFYIFSFTTSPQNIIWNKKKSDKTCRYSVHA